MTAANYPDWNSGPVFALTSDVDWTSEYCVQSLLNFSAEHSIRPTLFVTHRSAAIEDAAKSGRAELGIHPNFLPGSTHGATPDAVIAHCLGLVPGCRLWRSHAYADGTHLALKMRAAGIRIDSNLCLHLQDNLMPLHHWSGILRLPVFWEDDVHWSTARHWRLAEMIEAFFSPGLKIINVHPFIFSLNIPDTATYQWLKPWIDRLDGDEAGELRSAGPGPADFLLELIAAVKQRGHRWFSLTEIAAAHAAYSPLPDWFEARY
jgi:hypothetical protein